MRCIVSHHIYCCDCCLCLCSLEELFCSCCVSYSQSTVCLCHLWSFWNLLLPVWCLVPITFYFCLCVVSFSLFMVSGVVSLWWFCFTLKFFAWLANMKFSQALVQSPIFNLGAWYVASVPFYDLRGHRHASTAWCYSIVTPVHSWGTINTTCATLPAVAAFMLTPSSRHFGNTNSSHLVHLPQRSLA